MVLLLVTLGLFIRIGSANNVLKREEIPENIKKEYNDTFVELIRKKDLNAFIIINLIYNNMFWNPMKYFKLLPVWIALILIILNY
ncbi:hypothetical protein [Lactococcus garvieae]|uniref:hypothetical protein n=1 Tax=Lactococcus garvieae TaxID=1363 RepID=UPI0009C0DFD4|nr:hypothetical protein [Lactococcus garvieae]